MGEACVAWNGTLPDRQQFVKTLVEGMLPTWLRTMNCGLDIIAGMAIIKKPAARRLYINEWFEYLDVNDAIIAGRLGLDRSTVWKWRDQPHRLDPDKIADLAWALGIEPEQLWSPPGRPSIDAMIRNQPAAFQNMAYDVIRRLLGKPETEQQ